MPGRLRGPNLQTTAGHCLLRFVISRRDLRRVWGVNPWSSSSFGEEPCKGGTPKSLALAVDQYEVKIHNVGQGWAGHDQITQLSEKMVGIIAVQIVLNRQALCSCQAGCFW